MVQVTPPCKGGSNQTGKRGILGSSETQSAKTTATDMDTSDGGRVSSPNQLAPDVLEGVFTNLLTESEQVSVRDLSDLQGMLTGQLTEEQAVRLRASRTAEELGRRASLITAGMSPLLVLDEVVGRRLAMQLDAMGYRGRKLVIYEAGGERHELSILEAISLLPLCRHMGMPSTVTLTGVELAPGTMTSSLSTFPIIELHSFSVGAVAPPVEAISPTIYTGKYIQVQALSVTKAMEISRNGGSVVASGHGGERSRKYDGLTVDLAELPAGCYLRRGCSCGEEEARAWARRRLLPPSDTTAINGTSATAASAGGVVGFPAAMPPVVFLCRVVDDGHGHRYPVLSTAGGGGCSAALRGV